MWKFLKDWLIILLLLSVAVTLLATAKVKFDDARIKREQVVPAFKAKHKCSQEGYISTRDVVLRTYRCDNGLFIEEDMK